ncbi:hypothetical protein niasHT_016932 [Heterodera trifolii]|uniref:BTB domain-containing protein n=1 Tax=Heterodera trifolii TaxID=157864 RepID=A0ABD2L364_9BILA
MKRIGEQSVNGGQKARKSKKQKKVPTLEDYWARYFFPCETDSSDDETDEGHSVVDRMKHLLSTGEDADVYFLVGDGDAKELLQAHKLIMKSASDVFEAMFRFDAKNEKAEFASSNCPVVEVPDVEAAAFKVMLSFIYADDLSGLNGDNAMAVLCAADKYNIPGLVRRSLKIPISELPNVFFAFAQARLFDLENYCNDCLTYIDKNADTLLKSEDFLQIDQKTLCEIFGREELKIREEISVWKACSENGIECSAENRRQMLGPALFKIRFPLFSKEDFSEKIVPSGILTTDEVTNVEQYHTNPNFCAISDGLLYPLKFPSHERVWAFGIIAMDIEKVSEFAGTRLANCRKSEAVHIGGVAWKMVAHMNTRYEDIADNEMCFYLQCDASEKGRNWSCECSAYFRIVSQKCDGPVNGIETHFSNIFDTSEYHFNYCITFAKLMDEDNGLWDKSEDKVTLAIDLMVKETKTEKPEAFEGLFVLM